VQSFSPNKVAQSLMISLCSRCTQDTPDLCPSKGVERHPLSERKRESNFQTMRLSRGFSWRPQPALRATNLTSEAPASRRLLFVAFDKFFFITLLHRDTKLLGKS